MKLRQPLSILSLIVIFNHQCSRKRKHFLKLIKDRAYCILNCMLTIHKSTAENQDALNTTVKALMSYLVYHVINYYG